MLWIVVLGLILGAGLVLRRFRPTIVVESRWMRVTTVDEEGRVLRSEWVRRKQPGRIPSHGAAHLRSYVDRLLASPAGFTSLSVFTPDGMRGFGLRKKKGEVALSLVFKRGTPPEREANARAFYQNRGIEPDTDYVARGDGTRVLAWPIEGDAAMIDAMCRTVLTELCGVLPEEGLNVRYEAHRDRRSSG